MFLATENAKGEGSWHGVRAVSLRDLALICGRGPGSSREMNRLLWKSVAGRSWRVGWELEENSGIRDFM